MSTPSHESPPEQARKVVVHRAGGYGRLTLETHPVPPIGDGEVRVRTEAVGVNFADCIVRMGLYASAREYVGWPITPGFDFAGVVDAVGEGVVGVEVGDEVFGVTRFGGYATHVVVPSTQLFPRPSELTVEQAAAFPTIYITAWYALHHLGAVEPGADVLVHSAAGGVGGALVQLAKGAGARVVGVVGGAHKVETALAHGADVVIDRSSQDLWAAADRAAPHGYRIIADANGVATLKDSYRRLAPQGRLVVYGFHTMFRRNGPGWTNPFSLALGWLRTPRFNPLDMTSSNKSVLAFNLSFLFPRQDILASAMAELLQAARDGVITPPPIQTFALHEVAEAHRALETGTTVGKLVLLTASS
ncbi:MAG: zinc-binding dehydrogenase [Deltaproteobacteria bacterium]|nr:zinc-binding dehydrogenase [Deltaproteobacteria bacterium]